MSLEKQIADDINNLINEFITGVKNVSDKLNKISPELKKIFEEAIIEKGLAVKFEANNFATRLKKGKYDSYFSKKNTNEKFKFKQRFKNINEEKIDEYEEPPSIFDEFSSSDNYSNNKTNKNIKENKSNEVCNLWAKMYESESNEEEDSEEHFYSHGEMD